MTMNLEISAVVRWDQKDFEEKGEEGDKDQFFYILAGAGGGGFWGHFSR